MYLGGNGKRTREHARATQDTRRRRMVMMGRSISRRLKWKVLNSCVVRSSRGRSHKVGPAAKVGPCPFAVVHNGASNFSLLVLSDVPESTNERYQNTSNAISKT